MFTKFFYDLRANGLKVTLSEFLTLQEALDKGLCNSSLTDFYHLCRMILVKSETDFDKFNMVFESNFKENSAIWFVPLLVEPLRKTKPP